MIWTIARREIRGLMRDGRFRTCASIVLALLVAALVTGRMHFLDNHRQQVEAQQGAREHWLKQGTKNPHSAAHFGVYAFQPSLPLSLVDQGVRPFTGVAVWLEAHKQDEFKYKPAQDANALQRFGELTAANILQVLLPLLIVLLVFPTFAGEREQGVLRQQLSMGVSRVNLAAGKALGIAITMAALLVPAAVIGSAAVAAAQSGDLLDQLLRTGVLSICYLLYLGAFVGVALAVSGRVRSSRTALVTLLAFWILNCLVVPRAMADLSRTLHPTPSSFAFSYAMEEELHTSNSEREAAHFKQVVLRKYGVDRVENLPVSFAGLSLQHGEEIGYGVFDKHYNALWNIFEQQNNNQTLGALIAPLLAVRPVSMGLAGSDFEEHRHFATAAERYRRQFISAINADIATHALGKAAYVQGENLWSRIPAFDYRAPGLESVLHRQLLNIGLLALWFALASIAAWRSAAHMEVG